MHHLQLAQHGGVGRVGALGHQGLVHGLGIGRAQAPQHLQQIQLGRSDLAQSLLGRAQNEMGQPIDWNALQKPCRRWSPSSTMTAV